MITSSVALPAQIDGVLTSAMNQAVAAEITATTTRGLNAVNAALSASDAERPALLKEVWDALTSLETQAASQHALFRQAVVFAQELSDDIHKLLSQLTDPRLAAEERDPLIRAFVARIEADMEQQVSEGAIDWLASGIAYRFNQVCGGWTDLEAGLLVEMVTISEEDQPELTSVEMRAAVLDKAIAALQAMREDLI